MKKTYLFVSILIITLFAPSFLNAEGNEKKEGFRFVVMGCLHYDGTNTADLELAVETMKKYNPDFVLFLGSIVDAVGERSDRAHTKPNTARAFKEDVKLSQNDINYLWDEFDSIVETLGVPVYDVPSERSIPANNVNLTARAFLKRHPYRYYSFNYENNLFILLDSESHNREDLKQRGVIDGEQLEFLKGEVKDYEKYDNVFVATHKTCWGEGWEQTRNWFEEVHPAINGKVDKVFGACAHYLGAEKKGAVEYITCGTAPDWPGEEPRPSFFFFLVVDVEGTNISTYVVPVTMIPLENIVPYPGVRKKRTSTAAGGQWRGATPIRGDQAIKRPKGPGANQLAYLYRGDSERGSRRRLERPERVKMLQVDEVVKRLGLKEGMEVVDIGAGSGVFAFPIAEAMNGTGKVYATETSKDAVDYLLEDREKYGVENLEPVLVKSKGVDPFYKEHLFDIVFVADTYELIKNVNKYFKDLRDSVKEETGRVFIVYYRFFSDFTETEFSDMGRVLRTLSAEGEEFPIYKRLRPETKSLVEVETEYKVSPKLRKLLLEDLNSMLEDRTLLREMDSYFAPPDPAKKARDYVFIGPTYFVLIDATVKRLRKEGVYGDPTVPMNEDQTQQLRRINRIVITEVFKNNKISELFTYDKDDYVNRDGIIKNMSLSGYRFVQEHVFLDYHYMLEFKRAK